MISSAHAASEGGTFSDPTFWVAVAFVLFFVLVGKTLWIRIAAMLDKRAETITKALAEAERLRTDALRARAEAEATLARATAEADAILAHAREETERMQARARTSLQTTLALREQQAKDRIAQAEAAATKQVRDTAVDVALSATRALLRDQVGGANAQGLVDQAIAELPRRLH